MQASPSTGGKRNREAVALMVLRRLPVRHELSSGSEGRCQINVILLNKC